MVPPHGLPYQPRRTQNNENWPGWCPRPNLPGGSWKVFDCRRPAVSPGNAFDCRRPAVSANQAAAQADQLARRSSCGERATHAVSRTQSCAAPPPTCMHATYACMPCGAGHVLHPGGLIFWRLAHIRKRALQQQHVSRPSDVRPAAIRHSKPSGQRQSGGRACW